MLFAKCPNVQPPPPRPPVRAHPSSSSSGLCARPRPPEDTGAPFLLDFKHKGLGWGGGRLRGAGGTRRASSRPTRGERARAFGGRPHAKVGTSEPRSGSSLSPCASRRPQGAVSISPPGTESAFLPRGAQPALRARRLRAGPGGDPGGGGPGGSRPPRARGQSGLGLPSQVSRRTSLHRERMAAAWGGAF